MKRSTCSRDGLIDIGDLTALIGYLYIPPNLAPVCIEEANIDGDVGGLVDIGDLTVLIAYLYMPPNPLPAACLYAIHEKARMLWMLIRVKPCTVDRIGV